MPKISKKGQELPSSPIRKLVFHSDEAKTRGVEVLHLNIGQPDIEAPKEAMEIVRKQSLKLLPYGSSQGSLSYRTQLCSYYEQHGIAIEPDDIIVTTGASEALSFTLNVICDAGDEIIIPEPFYANYNGFAAACSVEVIPVVSHFENQFELPPIEELKEKITDKTRAILICNPSNPTGYLYSEAEIKALIDLAVAHDIFIIVDEVYREFIYTEQSHYSVLKSEKGSEHAVMIDSVSKRYSLCGARVGCMISKNKALMATALKFAHLRLSPPALALMASEAAVSSPSSYLDDVKKEYEKRKNVTVAALEKIEGVAVSNPMGAFYCIAKLPVDSAEDFSKFLLTDFEDQGQTVMLAPAAGFYSSPELGKDQVRLAFVLDSKKLQRAAEILEKALNAYRNS
ncbi:MAG: pyridoxal phosphate-dependent aminotransferase [Flavobacteriaceae bacterium]|jgi:aspartate aminotransferase|nr:pyridoxal phosphate-dependent aminotransferase [Flavobacteriaceae bacterium]MBT6128321.1 pyridoxal phosphate-dependent aminotransferase [Flavobacteriaceae bacterium]MDG1942628.1 pyridoxal phosphate-dependent aminotransferase [Flavobacteriaceae bacterium]